VAKPSSGNLVVLKAVRLVELGFVLCLADPTPEMLLPQINKLLKPFFGKMRLAAVPSTGQRLGIIYICMAIGFYSGI
jgi:hypothetical protein